MDRVRNLLEQIQNRLEDLNKAERKVAEVILLNPEQATRFSIAALAQASKVSEPTVNRFCRSFGVSGYPELKLQLAQSLASGAAYVSRAVEADDNPEAYTKKIFGSAIASLDSALQALDPNLISRAVDLLIQARQIHFFGLGASAPVALDAQHKFFRLLLTAAAYSDPHMQAMSAVTLKPSDVAICISQSGRSKDLLITANVVRESGATLITLCPSQTPLAELATINLAIDVQEDTEIYTPLTSRIAHLVVIDVLAMGVAMARGPGLVNHLKSVKRSLRSLRLSPKTTKHHED